MSRTIVFGATVSEQLLYIAGLPQRLVTEGWDVHIVCSDGPQLERYAAVDGVTVHSLSMAREPSPMQDLTSFRRWLVLLRELRPDIVSVGTPKASWLAISAAWATRVPKRVYQLYGLKLETSVGIKRVVLACFERLTMALATEVVAVGPSLLERAVGLRLAPRRRFRIIGNGSANGVNIEQFSPTRFSADAIERFRSDLGLEPGVPVVGFVGRITRDKGLHDLAAAVSILRTGGIEFQLLIVGKEDDASGAEAVAQLRATGAWVVVTGFVDDPAIHYGVMDVFCLPSYREGFPTAVLEASASAVPVITSDATGAIDSVVDGVTGRTFPTGDVAALSERLAELYADEVTRRGRGAAGRAWVTESYSTEVVQDRIIARLGELAEHGR